jgi:hypothetical protein
MSRMTLKADQEAGLDAAFGHRLGDGLLNRDYLARSSVGKRSGVRRAASSHECNEREQAGAEFMRAASCHR